MRSSLYCGLMAMALATPVMAKLPPLSEEGKAKAAETAAKAAWADKVGLYKHCVVSDRIANRFRKTAASAAPPDTIAACADPGPFAYTPSTTATTATTVTPVKDKPIEASEAHSPPGTAVSPPSTNVPAAAATGKSK